jgi:hypothetical protein
MATGGKIDTVYQKPLPVSLPERTVNKPAPGAMVFAKENPIDQVFRCHACGTVKHNSHKARFKINGNEVCEDCGDNPNLDKYGNLRESLG